MKSLKIRAALFTFWLFAAGAVIIALAELARIYEGTEALRIAGIALFLGMLAWLIYKIRLGSLEDDHRLEALRRLTESRVQKRKQQ